MKKLRLLLSLLFMCLLASGCQTGSDPLPPETEYPLFSSYSEQASFRAPDGARMPSYRPFAGDGGETEILSFSRTYPAPSGWRDEQPAAAYAVCDQLWYQGLALDLEDWVDTAAADWADAQATGRSFACYPVEQSTDCTLETDRLWNFVTRLAYPAEYPFDRVMVETIVRSQFFDPADGAELDPAELFLIPEADLPHALYTLTADTWPENTEVSTPAEADFARWFSTEYLYLYEDGLMLEFPAGTLEDNAWLFPFSYQELDGILQPWAMPE